LYDVIFTGSELIEPTSTSASLTIPMTWSQLSVKVPSNVIYFVSCNPEAQKYPKRLSSDGNVSQLPNLVISDLKTVAFVELLYSSSVL